MCSVFLKRNTVIFHNSIQEKMLIIVFILSSQSKSIDQVLGKYVYDFKVDTLLIFVYSIDYFWRQNVCVQIQCIVSADRLNVNTRIYSGTDIRSV